MLWLAPGRRVLIALFGAAGMALDRPVVSAVPVTAYWEWPPAALLVAGPLIETRAYGSLGKDVPAWLPVEENSQGWRRREDG